jgi:hypothetical protein
MKLSPYDFSILVFLIAAAIGHYRTSRKKPDHVGIFHALLAAIAADLGSLALYPNRGLLPIAFSLAMPGSCLYGICVTHGFRARRAVAFVAIGAISAWTVSFAAPEYYAWVLLFSWCTIATLAWVCLLDPETRATGITRASSVALAASLLADLPGVFAWAKTGSWKAESVLTSLSVAMLATLPALWKLRTSEQSSLGSHYWRSGSGSGVGPVKIQTRCE